MRINQNRNEALNAYQSGKPEKIERFPTDKANDMKQPGSKKGIIIDISDHSRRIKSQNETIIREALSRDLSDERKILIANNINNGFYNKPDIVERIADKMIEIVDYII